MKKTLFALWVLTAHACISTQPVPGLLDQQKDYRWHGEHEDTTFKLAITDHEGIWFNGHLIINDTDTLFLRGFEKGEQPPDPL